MLLSSDLMISLETALKLELELHPAANLTDIYKLLYQALYGPSHIISDHATLCESIRQELNQMQGTYLPLVQNLGVYSRISLTILRGSEQPVSEAISIMADGLMASKAEVDESTFKLYWPSLRALIRPYYSTAESEWSVADAMIESGLIPSHSSHYKELYQPHYRLLKSSLSEPLERIIKLNQLEIDV